MLVESLSMYDIRVILLLVWLEQRYRSKLQTTMPNTLYGSSTVLRNIKNIIV